MRYEKKCAWLPVSGRLGRLVGAGMLMTMLLTACETKSAGELLDFQYSDEKGAIVYEDTQYYPYGISQKADMTEQIGILDHEDNNKIFSYQDYAREEFIISYLETGLMDNPVLYRASGCRIEPGGVAVFTEMEERDIIWLVDDVQVEDANGSGYFADGYSYQNYFEIEDVEDSIVYVVLGNAETMTLEEVISGLDGKADASEMVVAGYYRKQD